MSWTNLPGRLARGPAPLPDRPELVGPAPAWRKWRCASTVSWLDVAYFGHDAGCQPVYDRIPAPAYGRAFWPIDIERYGESLDFLLIDDPQPE